MPAMKKVSVAVAAGALLAVSACGGGGSSSSGSGGSSGGGGGSASADQSRGPITFVQGKDNSNVVRPLVDKWNAAHPDERVTFKEQSDKADQQHDDLVQNFQAKNPDYDVVSVDNIWTGEFAAKQWLVPFKGAYALDTSPMLPATVKSGTYNGTLYAAPNNSDGGLLYYRKDLVPNPPKSWDEMMQMCPVAKQNGIGCYAGQYAQYEGLTVNAAEAVNTAGGVLVKPDGKTPAVDSTQAKQGLQRLQDAYKSGNIPQQAITYQEEQGRQSFEDGKLMFMRNWPYAYKLASTDGSSVVKDKFGVAPLPGNDASKPGASSLGGHNLGISVYGKHKATAFDFVKFWETEDSQRFQLTQGSVAPVMAKLYSDPQLTQQFAYLPTLLTSIQNAVPRPVSPFYPAITKAVQDNVTQMLTSGKSVDQTVSDLQKAIGAAGGGS